MAARIEAGLWRRCADETDPELGLRAVVHGETAALPATLTDHAWLVEAELALAATAGWAGGDPARHAARAEALLRAARDPDRAMAGRLGEALRHLGEAVQNEDGLRRSINRFARRAAVGAAASYGDGIVKLVSETIRGWDAGKVTERVESAVGRDLQYIRINGTLVGGLVGLVIHALDVWL